MFIGYYKLENKENFNIYYNNIDGWYEWNSETFSPETKDIKLLLFKMKGKTYQERKASLQELAIDWQLNFSGLAWSYAEIANIQEYFYRNAKKYGLVKEFKENAIC